jgi:large subunit ribosomal protein L25
MADNVELQAREREGRGKNDARRLRARGMVPAVLYGDSDGGENMVLAVPTKVVDYTLQHLGDNALYDIKLGDRGGTTARIVDAQRNPLTGKLVHVDFAPVNMRERIVVTVPLAVMGDSPGVEEGGVLQQVVYEVEVESLPGDIPQEVELDVSNLGLNENLALADVTLPEGVTLISDPEGIAVTVTPPTEVTEEEMEAAGIVEEPSEEAAEEAGVEEGTEEIPTEERETGPAGQNLQP